MRIALAALFLLVAALPARAATPLVDVAWVRDHIGKPGVMFLDVRSRGDYAQAHIPGAVNTDYAKDGWRVKLKGVKGLLPKREKLAMLFGRLGIANRVHVVIIPGGYGAGEVAAATRIYWTLKLMGHQEISILDGGMMAWWAAKKNPLVRGIEKPRRTRYDLVDGPDILATEQDIKKHLKDGGLLIDSRVSDMFLGINKSGSAKIPGTLPGARNVPGQWLTVDGGGKFRDAATIAKLYKAAKTPTDGDTILFCNTGHWASLGWFVAPEVLGNKQAKLYDGSLAQWTQDKRNPVEVKVKLD